MPNDGPATPFITTNSSYPAKAHAYPGPHSYHRMKSLDSARHAPVGQRHSAPWVLIASYVFDWIVLVIFGVVALILGRLTPNKRPFSLEDPNISFPFTVDETVPASIAFVANTVAPIVIIIVISLVFVPGSTVPRGTPKSLVWKRKLWELHIGLLGLALSVIAAFFITNGMKNMFGKPRPDLLSRCQPDLANLSQYIVGGIANVSSNGQLVSGDICKNPDKAFLDDGFRSYPSGHSSSSAAGLLYLSLFIASKFAITLPFLAPASYSDASSFSAFPSRLPRNNPSRGRTGYPSGAEESYELTDRRTLHDETLAIPSDPSLHTRLALHATTVAAVRRQAAAPPLYLLGLCVLPTFGAVFIAGSRWFDFRHHGFDILFGFLIGTMTAIFAFRYYHLPISQGAGWAWGPRSRDKAFWAGIGSFSYATDHMRLGDADFLEVTAAADAVRPGDEEEAIETVGMAGRGTARGSGWASGEERTLGRKTSPPPGPGETAPEEREESRYGAAPEREEGRFGTAY